MTLLFSLCRAFLRRQRLCMTVCLLATLLPLQAQPEEGKTYYIRARATDYVVSNLNSGQNDAPVITEPQNDKAYGQKWHFTKATSAEGVFIITSAGFPTAAIDVNPNRNYYLLNWTASTTSQNQQLLVKAVEGVDNVYQLIWHKTPSMAVTALDDCRLQLTSDLTSEATWFVLEETTPQALPERNKWEDETVFGVNKLPAHATFMPYATTEALRADAARYAKPWLAPEGAEWLTLNGLWKLHWTTTTTAAPGEEYWADEADVTEWDTISVPSCLEMKGYGSPYYINVDTPFLDDYPTITMRAGCLNSVASYRRHFTLPEGWADGRRVVLHFDGIYSAANVWVNGQYVGYTQESNNDAEFDLSGVVREGDNNICVQVVRFSDGSFLEGQDMWRMSGIHRDVYLYATPTTYIQDHYLTTDFTTLNYLQGNLNVALTLAHTGTEATEKEVKVSLIGPDGSLVASGSQTVALGAGETEAQTTVTLSGLSDLQLWSAEQPTLYTVEISQLAANGTEEMAFATKYGFRHIAIKNGKVYLNGKAVLFKGVNTQDTHPVHGRSIDVATMERDVCLMKQANINTVRGSHYPRQAKMYSLFDYYGLYCMDEADIECHYNWEQGGNAISRAESWRPQFVDRMERMVMRDRNFPSIIFWSLGNESGTGANIEACYNRTKELDPGRIVHYEGATRGGTAYSDLWSVMYPSVSEAESKANYNWRKQPYFMCEYAHAMGNGVGNLREYWDAIEKSTYGIGGCIWDFVDQSIYAADDIKNGTLTQNGKPKYMTGYDFPGPHQGNFVNNGLVTADRAWSPELAQVKQVYQYVSFGQRFTSGSRLKVNNNYAFTDLNRFDARYTLLCDGREVETGAIDKVNCLAGNMTYIDVPYTTTPEEGHEYLLNVELLLAEATPWAEAGYPVARTQIVLQEGNATLNPVATDTTQPVTLSEAPNGSQTVYTLTAGKVAIDINNYGQMRKWTYGGKPIIANIYNRPEYANFRWVENDEAAGNKLDGGNGVTSYTLETLPTIGEDGSATWTSASTGTLCQTTYDYHLYPDGTLDIRASYTPQTSNLRRLGTAMTLPAGFEEVDYYARGPWDNYCDRKDAAFVGRYSTTVTDMLEPTPRPQSSGNRTGLRALSLTNPSTQLTLQVEAEGQAEFSVLHFTDYELSSLSHNWNVPTTVTKTILHIDYAQKGLGNGSCGKQTGTLSTYCLPSSGTYSHVLRFKPFFTDETGINETTVDDSRHATVKVSDGMVNVSGHFAADSDIVAYDLGGSTMARTKAAAGHSSVSLDLRTRPHGVYLIKVGKTTFKVVR